MSDDYMFREIREQPLVLRKIREGTMAFLEAEPVDWRGLNAIHLLGCGDMDFAARTAAWLAGPGGPEVRALSSMDMRWRAERLGGRDLVVAASFSGRTPRTVEAARLARGRGARVWGITGNPDSPLTRAVDRLLLLETGPKEELTRHAYAGYHHNVPQTKTFTAVLLAELLLLGSAGCLPEAAGPELEALEQGVAAALPVLEEGVRGFMDTRFRPVQRIAVLGSGPWRALAAYGAAKLVEMAVPSRHQCLEENNHLEMFVTDAEDLLVFLAPDRASWTRAMEMVGPYGRLGALRVVLAPKALTGSKDLAAVEDGGSAILSLPDSGTWTRVFILAVALQLLTAALGTALGRDIDQWVGGVRVGLIEELGQALVRNSIIGV